ncbi:LysR family transcriptional regulator [Nitrogeniibacter mangrovi]|uniref:LysR family transcriptional regulator n=1 Tax=Nitrogeniibacter mangrovi TaxID=2016596 RepID=A0A6C1B5F5_9RHOO|nr:LysR family transcriptional regulator [Nitrogeniibacter mangrovi]QID18921.1 LysR family transcriptional regulator [Nitrogeniibacter mangrovi]
MKLSLDALHMLDVIDSEGSFAAAARRLHRVPSALTHAVRRLEADLGYPLFQREGRRAVLTVAGSTLLDQGRVLLRAAGELECRAKRVATGWEAQLRIGLDAVICFEDFLPLAAAFLAEQNGTRLSIEREVLGGSWDALASGRADLVIGASGDAPPQTGLASAPLGVIDLVFCVSPHHPLAGHPDPLPTDVVSAHRAIVLADTSRTLQPRSAGLFEGQDTMVVPDFPAKLAAQIAGLGVGYLPPQLARPAIARGDLVARRTSVPPPRNTLHVAWRSSHQGHALAWFRKRLAESRWRERLARSTAPIGAQMNHSETFDRSAPHAEHV